MEVSCLTYLEYRAWRTIYTPLCALMLPYVAVLLITIAIPADFGFVRFNYESIYVWILGLPLFAIPSFGFATLMRHYQLPVISTIKDEEKGLPTILLVISILLVAVLLLKLYTTLSHGFYLFGTEDFAEEFSGHGIWAHLRGMIIPILILALYFVRKTDFLLWGLIGLMLVIQFSYMVKGAIIITVVSALMMKLYTGKIRLNLTLVLGVILGAVLVFYLIYTPLSSWLTENFGLDNHTWRVTILFFNIIILLFPCRRLAGFMRYTLYIVDRGREYYNTHHYGPVMEKRISDAFSTLAIGAAMDVLIVLIVPNGIETRYHVVLLLVVLALSIFYQWRMFRKEAEKVESPIENEDLLSEEEIV